MHVFGEDYMLFVVDKKLYHPYCIGVNVKVKIPKICLNGA